MGVEQCCSLGVGAVEESCVTAQSSVVEGKEQTVTFLNSQHKRGSSIDLWE